MLKNFFLKIYRFFIQWNFHFGIALILSIFTKSLNRKSKYRVLSLNKSIFSSDLEEIKKVNSKLQFLSFPRLMLSEIIKKYVDYMPQQTSGSIDKIISIHEEEIDRCAQNISRLKIENRLFEKLY